MRTSAGLGMMMVASALAAAPLLAQSAQPAQPQPETVGPRELRDFSLPGSTPAPAPAQPQTQPESAPPAAAQDRPATAAPRPGARLPAARSTPGTQPATQPAADPPQELQSQPQDAVPPPVEADSLLSQPQGGPIQVPPDASTPVPQDSWGILPWLVAALLAVAGTAFALHRRRARSALANATELEAFVPPEPTMPSALAASATARRSTPASSGGIVSTRLRPSLELQFTPLRCVIDDQQASIEFALAAVNTGNAPARDVRIEVAMINAGPAQDQEIGRFFEQPAGVGDPLEGIPPMRSIRLDSRVSMPLDQVRAFEVAGRRLFVPLLAFNALYRWSGGDGQTSLSFLIGREGDGDKLAPFRLDLGPRIFRNLGARPHHMHVRR